MSERSIRFASGSNPELVELRETLRDLSRKLDRLSDRVLAIEESQRSSASYSLVHSESRAFSPESRTVTRNQVPYSPTPSSPNQPVSDSDWAERELVAAGVGRFLARALAGDFRGNSGRSRVKLASNYYIVVRDAEGLITTRPVRIFKKFSDVRRLCHREGRDFGDCVFVGLPTLEEVDWCLNAAGFTRPASLH